MMTTRSRYLRAALALFVFANSACSPPDENNTSTDRPDMSAETSRDMGDETSQNSQACEKARLCDPEDPARIIEVDSCTGASSVIETCAGETPYCSTKSPANQVIDAVCSDKPCTSSDRVVCDPDAPRELFERDTCTGELTPKRTCDMLGSGCIPGQLATSDAKCGNICGSARHTTVCDPSDPEKVYWGDECGNVRTLKESCSGDDVCVAGEDGAECGVATCIPETLFVCNPDDPSAVYASDSCSGELTLHEACTGGDTCAPGQAPGAPATCGACDASPTYACDPDDATRILVTDGCTGETTLERTCEGDGESCVVGAAPTTLPSCEVCEPELEQFCDPERPTEILERDSCTGVVTVVETCEDIGEGCVPGPLSTSNPRCENICGSRSDKLVCDPARPNSVFWTDECGNITREYKACIEGSTCELDEDGEGQCSCVQVETDCTYPRDITDYYGISTVVGIDSCGGETELEQCAFGTRCFQDQDYNGGVAECARSIDPVQASSPYYDHGCFNITELTTVKTKLEADCRCRYIGSGGMGTGFADPITKARPGNSLEVCQAVDRVTDLTWPVPAGSGPTFSAFHKMTSGVKWHGGWVDKANKLAYAVVSWTSPTRRQAGTVVSFDLRTGARKVISGVYPDPSTGETSYGSGYESPNPIVGGPATQPLSAVNAMRHAPDGNLYTFGLGTTGQGTSNSAEIVRVDPTTGARTLVWQSQTIERGVNTSPYGQCLRHNYVPLSDGTDAYESVALDSRSFAIGPQGQFYMTFSSTYEGNGVIEVSADGSSCRFVSRWGARDFQSTPADPTIPAPANIGGGYTPQYNTLYNPGMIRNGKLYIVTNLNLIVMTIDITTGDRVAISQQPSSGFGGMGRTSMYYDNSRNLIITAGGPANVDGAWLDETTGRREELFADTTLPGTPLVQSAYSVRRSVFSWVGTTVVQTNTTGYGPMFMDPDDPDILYFVLVGGALLKYEISTFNNFIFSL